jgi:hypothetical protein
MNADQSFAVETISNGHNLILTGQAGTGKKKLTQFNIHVRNYFVCFKLFNRDSDLCI